MGLGRILGGAASGAGTGFMMSGNPWGALAGAVAGGGMAAMSQQEDNRQRQLMNEAAAVQTQYSPWTGMGAGRMQGAKGNDFGSALEGVASGAAMYQNALKAQQTKDVNTAVKDPLNLQDRETQLVEKWQNEVQDQDFESVMRNGNTSSQGPVDPTRARNPWAIHYRPSFTGTGA